MSCIFFSTVQYGPSLKDDSWTSYAEAAADFCRAPGRWVAAELWDGGKKKVITALDQNRVDVEEKTPEATGFKRAVRFIIGIATCVFGNLLALPLMAFAYLNEEIRLKHQAVHMKTSPETLKRLNELVEERQRLAKERQGCEPISCLLVSICCLLCCLVCRGQKA